MVGSYGDVGSPGLEYRKPSNLFGPLGWLAASVLNPAGWFAWMLWGMPHFDMQVWGWYAVAPLQLSIVFAMMFLREGGFGIGAVSVLILICTVGASAVLGLAYAVATWQFQQHGIAIGLLGDLPIFSLVDGLAHAGTHIRMAACFAGVAAIPAIIIVRVIALQRMPRRKRTATATASASLPGL